MSASSNAAFDGADRAVEVARILTDLATRVEGGAIDGPLTDINGNTVGRFNSGTIIE